MAGRKAVDGPEEILREKGQFLLGHLSAASENSEGNWPQCNLLFKY